VKVIVPVKLGPAWPANRKWLFAQRERVAVVDPPFAEAFKQHSGRRVTVKINGLRRIGRVVGDIDKALRTPLSLGEKVTEIVHVPWAASGTVQVFVWVQSFGKKPVKLIAENMESSVTRIGQRDHLRGARGTLRLGCQSSD